jgi:protein TonB
MKNIPWDDLVFQNRNRSYGAYILRKEYPSALATSVVSAMVVMALLVASPVVMRLIQKAFLSDKVVTKVIYVVEPPPSTGPSTQPKTIEPLVRN